MPKLATTTYTRYVCTCVGVNHCVGTAAVALVAVVVVAAALFLLLGCFLTILMSTSFLLLSPLAAATMLLLFSTVRFLSALVLRVIHTYSIQQITRYMQCAIWNQKVHDVVMTYTVTKVEVLHQQFAARRMYRCDHH
jgi:hypothetical protein